MGLALTEERDSPGGKDSGQRESRQGSRAQQESRGEAEDLRSGRRGMGSWGKIRGNGSHMSEQESGRVAHKDELHMERSRTSQYYKRRKSLGAKVE